MENNFKKNRALLVIDVQNGLTKKKSIYNYNLFIATINQAILKFRNKAEIIIFVQHNNKILIPGSFEWEIDYSVKKFSGDPIIQKKQGDAFKSPELIMLLRSFNVNEIIVSGIASNGCVKNTCLGGKNHGFVIKLLKNGHTNWHKSAVQISEKTMSELSALGIDNIGIDEI